MTQPTDVYDKFRRAWVRRVVDGPRFASELAEARSTMEADPAYDPEKYRAVLFEAAAEADAIIASDLLATRPSTPTSSA